MSKRASERPNPPEDVALYVGHRKRLRTRFLQAPECLLDYEIIELLLCLAQPRGDVKPQAKALMARFKTLASLLSASPEQITEVAHLGQVSVLAIKLIPEMMKRVLREDLRTQPLLNNSSKVVDYCYSMMAHLENEQFRILFLDRKHYLIVDEIQHDGTLDRISMYPREIIKQALALNAGGLIMVHNHPSGDSTPSAADIQATQALRQALRQVEIHVLDHVVIARHGSFSFREKGLL